MTCVGPCWCCVFLYALFLLISFSSTSFSYALSNMANHKTIRPNVVAVGGVEPLIHLVKGINTNSEKCSKLIVPATTALSKLIKLDDVTCQQVVSSGLIEHLLQVRMRTVV